MAEQVYLDSTFLLFPELKRAMEAVLEEHEKGLASDEAAEHARNIITRLENLQVEMVAASRRLNGVAVPIEMRELSEVVRYGFTALKRMLVTGDSKYHVFFSEILYETRLYRSAFTNILTRAAELLNGEVKRIIEINDPAPLLSVRAAFRHRAELVVLDTPDVYDDQAVQGIQSDYIKKYLLPGKVAPIDESQSYEGDTDLVAFTFIDAWRVGFSRLLDHARRLLRPGGMLAAVVPLNSREGLRTILRAWRVTDTIDPERLRGLMEEKGFTDFRARSYGVLAAVTATAK